MEPNTPVWEMYNLPAPTQVPDMSGIGMSQSSGQPVKQSSDSSDLIGSAVKSGAAKGLYNDVNSGMGLGLSPAGSGSTAGAGILKSIGSSLMAAFGI